MTGYYFNAIKNFNHNKNNHKMNLFNYMLFFRSAIIYSLKKIYEMKIEG
jgi:hypothetical protein